MKHNLTLTWHHFWSLDFTLNGAYVFKVCVHVSLTPLIFRTHHQITKHRLQPAHTNTAARLAGFHAKRKSKVMFVISFGIHRTALPTFLNGNTFKQF